MATGRVFREIEVPYKSQDSGVIYRLSRWSDGAWSCDCPNFRIEHRRGVSECKHLKTFKREIGAART